MIVYIMIGTFLIYDMIILTALLFNNNTSLYLLNDNFILKLGHTITTCLMILGIIILIEYIMWFLRISNLKHYIKPWQRLTLFANLIFIIIYDLLFGKVVFIGVYPVIIIDYPIWSLIIILFTTVFGIFLIWPKYSEFMKISYEDIFKNRFKKALVFSQAKLIFIISFLSIVIIRNHFENTWNLIITLDIALLIVCIFGLTTSYFYSYGEDILCILNIEAIYLYHESGKKIYSKIYKNLHRTKDFSIGSFLIAISAIFREIRSNRTYIDRIVMDDESEIILSSGKYSRGLLIVRQFNHLFREKLDNIIKEFEKLKGDSLKQWFGGSQKIDSQIEEIIMETI